MANKHVYIENKLLKRKKTSVEPGARK